MIQTIRTRALGRTALASTIGAVLISLVSVTPAHAANQPPIAVDDTYSVHPGATISVPAPGVLRNDSDPDGDPLQVVRAYGGYGLLSMKPDGSFTYTSRYPYRARDVWKVVIADPSGEEATSDLVFTISNGKPVALPDTYMVKMNSAISVPAPGVLANDSDPDGDALHAVLVTDPSHGTLRLQGTGDFQYIPTPGFFGTDQFQYVADDRYDRSDPATVTIIVFPPNWPPSTVADAYATPLDTPLSVPAPGVLANDSDIEGSPLTARLNTPPTHGTATIAPDGALTYVPAAGFQGVDNLTYFANDGTSDSAPTNVRITVGNPNAGTGGSTSGGTGGSSGGSGSGGALQEILSIRPAAGPVTGGNTVALVGFGFTDATSVLIGGKAATFTIVNDAHIDVVMPAGDRPGPVDVSVVISPTRGRAFAANGYVYTVPGTLSASSGQPTQESARLVLGVRAAKPKGPRVRVTVTVSNAGAGPTTGATRLVDQLPKGVKASKVKAPKGWSCTVAARTLSCSNPGTLGAGSMSVVAYTAKVTAPKGKKLSHTVTALSTTVGGSLTARVVAKIPRR